VNEHRERLVAAVKSGQAILILGAGTSMAMTGGAATSNWVGLIKHGIEAASTDEDWAAMQQMNLDYALDKSDISGLVGVASQIAAKLKAQSPQKYSDWLRDSVGSLRPRHTKLAHAVAALGLPILTTNYDDLVEKALGVPSINWTNPEAMRAVFRHEDKAVGHLHGVWTSPESVIFSESDYTRLLGDERGQFVQQAHYSTKSFIYIGFGGGLHDPNFSRLVGRHSAMFPESRGDHFRLCLDAEVSDLEDTHGSHDIRVISYGSGHEQLADYIDGLSSEVGAESDTNRDRLTFAREAILDQIRAETVVGSHIDEATDCELGDITVAPVILPVPHEQFASMQDYDDDLKPRRIDAEESYSRDKLVILAGEELSGITTALRWLVAKAAFERPGSAPIFVDGRRCCLTRNPLNQQVRQEAILRRIVDHKRAELPDHVMAIDNLVPDDTNNYYNLINDIRESHARFIVIGVKIGDEHQLFSDLKDNRLTPEIVYLGKLGRTEIDLLARMVAPKRSAFITDAVQDALRREHLPRNPFTVSLLVCLFAQLGEASKHSSETAVLDDYVNLLLGRNGSEFLDARYALDPQNRQVVLAALAKVFVRQRKGALGQDDAIRCIKEYFSSVSWKEDPIRTLETFREIRVLRVTNGIVQFQQSSYLHLFAAKAAIDDPQFLEELLADSVFFAPIIRHYAALLRSDSRVVEHAGNLLKDLPAAPLGGRIFGKIEQTQAPEELGGLFQGPVPDEDGDSPESGDRYPNAGEAIEEYDYSDDADMVPFPLEDLSKLSPTVRRIRAVDLASRVLRDSDQLANLDLKLSVFKLVLLHWGLALDSMEKDAVFEEPARSLVESLVEKGDIKREKAEEMTSRMAIFIPTFVIFSGLSACLTSRKLLLLHEDLIKDDAFRRSDHGMTMAAMFAFDIQDKNWTKMLPDLITEHGHRWIVSEFLGMLATITFRTSELSSYDEGNLRTFLKGRVAKRYTFDSEQDKKTRVAKYEQDLTRDRVLHRKRRLPQGSSVMESLTSGDG
jgi:hypothetical protein